MWNDPLVTPKPAVRPPAGKAPPKKAVKAKSKAKAKTPTVAKLQREIKALQVLTRQQDVALKQLSETVKRFTENHERSS